MNTQLLAPAAALGAMSLALVVALGVRPSAASATSAAWPAAIEAGLDHITPTELSKRLLADPHSVLLVDVRPADEFAAFHLPGAINLDVVDLLGAKGEETLSRFGGDLIVLCSNGMTHPAQAWVELARRGRTDVRVLEDGLDGFARDVLTPPSLRGATTEERAAAEYPEFAAARVAFLAKAVAATEQTPVAPEPAKADVRAHLATDPAELATPTIVSAAWIAKRGPAVIVLDAREKPAEYAAGHLPGARHVPIQMLREDRDGVPDQLLLTKDLAVLFGRLGIDAATEVVVYGETKLQDAAHLALALVSVGHQKVAILEGGLQAWKDDGHALSVDVPVPVAKTYTPRPAPAFHSVGIDEVAKASAGSTVKIVDVRPADAFRGDVSTEARAGHIPHSSNRPYTADLANVAGAPYWRSVDDLRREYEAMGLRRGDPVIVSCRTGHQAAQTWFTLRYVLGYEDVRWYDGSWKEWAARTDLPVEIGAGAK